MLDLMTGKPLAWIGICLLTLMVCISILIYSPMCVFGMYVYIYIFACPSLYVYLFTLELVWPLEMGGQSEMRNVEGGACCVLCFAHSLLYVCVCVVRFVCGVRCVFCVRCLRVVRVCVCGVRVCVNV